MQITAGNRATEKSRGSRCPSRCSVSRKACQFSAKVPPTWSWVRFPEAEPGAGIRGTWSDEAVLLGEAEGSEGSRRRGERMWLRQASFSGAGEVRSTNYTQKLSSQGRGLALCTPCSSAIGWPAGVEAECRSPRRTLPSALDGSPGTDGHVSRRLPGRSGWGWAAAVQVGAGRPRPAGTQPAGSTGSSAPSLDLRHELLQSTRPWKAAGCQHLGRTGAVAVLATSGSRWPTKHTCLCCLRPHYAACK